ncbi:unnamed protein product [Malus baccata var. baccata]
MDDTWCPVIVHMSVTSQGGSVWDPIPKPLSRFPNRNFRESQFQYRSQIKFSGIPIFGNPEIVSGFRDKSGIPKWFWAFGLKFDILCFWAKIQPFILKN